MEIQLQEFYFLSYLMYSCYIFFLFMLLNWQEVNIATLYFYGFSCPFLKYCIFRSYTSQLPDQSQKLYYHDCKQENSMKEKKDFFRMCLLPTVNTDGVLLHLRPEDQTYTRSQTQFLPNKPELEQQLVQKQKNNEACNRFKSIKLS